MTAKILGDFEFTPDPNDPAQHLIYVNHAHNGPSSIVVASVDGMTGQIIGSTLTDIADNFQATRSSTDRNSSIHLVSGSGCCIAP